MAGDESAPRPPSGTAGQPTDAVAAAINWLSNDGSDTRQSIDFRGAVVAPGQLLEEARFELEVEGLLTERPADQAQDLIRAQADWLIRHLPLDHDPPSVDSAQQAGRAWGVLISADTQVLPDQDVLTEVSRSKGISLRAVEEIRTQARAVSGAYNRADLIFPYDRATDAILIDDWNTLVACGSELPEAAERAKDVLELLTARVAGTDDYSWMDAAAQQAAQVYFSVTLAQVLLTPVAALIPAPDQPGAGDDETRLVEAIEQGDLAAAATAAARACAVQDWVEQDGAEPDRSRRVEAAAPGTRTLVRLEQALAALDPTHSQAPRSSVAPERLARIVEAIGRLSVQVRDAGRASSPLSANPVDRPAPQQHQQPPHPGQASGGAAPRAAP